MAEVYKPKRPLIKKGKYLFPRTTADQVYIDPETDTMLDAKLAEMDNATAAAAAAAQAAGNAAAQAEAAAGKAQGTADAAMPKTGGTFTGDVAATAVAATGDKIRNTTVKDASGNLVAASCLIFTRK